MKKFMFRNRRLAERTMKKIAVFGLHLGEPDASGSFLF